MSTKSGATAPTIIEEAEAMASDITGLAGLLARPGLTAAEAEYVTGLAFLAADESEAVGVQARVLRYRNLGAMVTGLARTLVNTGSVVGPKGTALPVLASNEAVTFAHVRAALKVQTSEDRWTPNVPGARPVGRTEVQRYWEAGALDAIDIDRAVAVLTTEAKGTAPENAKAIIERAATLKREASMTADERAKAATKANTKAAEAKAKADAKARREAREAEAIEAGAAPWITAEQADGAGLASLLATYVVVVEAIERAHAKAEAEHAKATTVDEAFASLAEAAGLSIEEFRAVAIEAAEARRAARAEAATA